MKLTVRIEGMMCEHCVRAVKKALESIDGVSADVSLEKGTAVVESAGELDAARLRAAVEEEGYQVLEIA